jgi:uncharacterized Fe-S cluster-containing radical SAM superfamily protein
MAYMEPTRIGITTLPAQNAYYLNAVRAHVIAAPAAAVGRTLEKAYLMLHGREIRRSEDLAWLREHSVVARLLVWEWGVMFPFGLLLPLALLAPRQALRPGARAALFAGAAFYLVAVAMFVPAGRYRVPVVLLLLPLAAIAGASLVRVRGRFTVSKRVAGFAALALVACNLPNAFSATFASTPVEQLLSVSQAHLERGEVGDALRLAASAVEGAPRDVDARIALGKALMGNEHLNEAAEEFAVAARLAPHWEAPWILGGHAMLRLNQLDRAAYDFEQALARNPYHPVALRDLARVRRFLQ